MNEKTGGVCFDSWSDARKAFILSIGEIGGEFQSLDLGQKGPGGESLSIGIGTVLLGHSSKNSPSDLFLHVSGVHGVEGFAGSAAQLQILRELSALKKSGRIDALPRIRVVFVHTVNAYGMSWLRRNNADNVDLNRNAFLTGDNLPDGRAYHQVHQILTDESWRRWLCWLRLAAMTIRRGKQFLMQGLSGGQYHYADGFFYGGDKWQPELSRLKNFFEQNFSDVQRVFAVDIHTGLGPYGFEALFSTEVAEQGDLQLMQRQLNVKLTLDEIEGRSTYRSFGSFSNLIYQAFPKSKVRYILQEFGTYNDFRVLRGLRSERGAWLRGKIGPDSKASRHLKNLFFPQDSRWRQKILADASGLFFKVLNSGF